MTPGTSGPRIGLLGGTFNPIHLGHLRAAEEVREALDLERVLFIPSAVPPHKRADAEDPIADAGLRLEWVESATAISKSFSVDRIEIDRPGPSYLVDTLEAIRALSWRGEDVVCLQELFGGGEPKPGPKRRKRRPRRHRSRTR